MVLIGPGCKLLRREPVEASIGPVGVIVAPPALDDSAGLAVAR